jgi:FKBP-type peptidyl-prolyl cis-trans isomerase FklB
MKKIFVAMVCLSAAAPLFADGTNQFTDEKSRVSYAVGIMTGHQWKQQMLDIDPDIYAKAIKDVLAGNPEQMTEAEVKDTLTVFQKEFRAKQQARMAELAAKGKSDGVAFLAANKTQPGVQTLPDGLQYLVLTNGIGPVPAATDTVTVNYRGTLVDGTEFDSSYKRGQPTSFEVGKVIRGWTEALEKMPVGSKWKLFIPSELAYGEQGNRGIPPNSVLIFDVELLGTQPATPATPLTSDIIKVPSKAELDKGAQPEVIKAEDVQKLQAQQKP